MKKFLLTTGLLATLTVSANSFKTPDVIIDTKLDYDFSKILVRKFKMLCRTFNLNDPFEGKFEAPFMINESSVGDLLPADSKNLIKDFGNAVGLNILNGETNIWMHGFSYDVRGFKTNLKADEEDASGIAIKADVSAERINLAAKKVILTLVIPGKVSSPVFEVEVINPQITARRDHLINFSLDLKIQDYLDHYKFQVKKANFDTLARGLMANARSVRLTYDKVIIPKVSIKIGNKTVNFSPEKIEDLIRRNNDAIKGVILAQAANLLQSNTTQSALKVIEKYKINKDYWLKTSALFGKVSLGKFSTDNGDNIRLSIPGDFCTTDAYQQHKDQCIAKKQTLTALSRLSQVTLQDSLDTMTDLTINENAHVVVSVSEDYLNKLLATAHDAGLLKNVLDQAGVTLGPNKIITRLDKEGESATLIMDVIYKPSKMERVLTGSTVIRFPLVMDLSLRIEKQDESPVFMVALNGIDTSDETLIYGRPDQGIISTVKDVPRFQGKVAKGIREKISKLNAENLFELKYPELKGLDLDKVDFLSDGNGRMNAIVRIEELLNRD